MIGLVVILLSSIVLLRIFKVQLSAFGLQPTLPRIKSFSLGFLVSALASALYFYLIIEILDYSIEINTAYSISAFLKGAWWTLRSVLYEEFLFRGALLILAIKFLGKHKACLLSSVIFGIYHWFSYDVFGSLLPMLNTFLITFIGGLMFAYAYAETRSLYLPIALHFGWNLITITIFSEGPLGDQLLISSGGKPMGYLYFAFLIYQILMLPGFTYLYLKIRQVKKHNTFAKAN
ncbi:MAG: CPBP family intramembrane metalloprotease [Gramella sp.]|nr:CPBP family intramembrane metalloprotease [Christiangramia sp.]